MRTQKENIVEYLNTSKFTGGGWEPTITGYDVTGNIEIKFELDLYEGAMYNWEKFKEKNPAAANRNSFFAAYREAKEETEYQRNLTR